MYSARFPFNVLGLLLVGSATIVSILQWLPIDQGNPVVPGNKAAVLRLLSKSEAAHRLVGSKQTLMQMAAQFKEIDEATSSSGLPSLEGPECEAYCRQVILYCRQMLAWPNLAMGAPPAALEALVQRLEAELDDYLCRDGAVGLPAQTNGAKP